MKAIVKCREGHNVVVRTTLHYWFTGYDTFYCPVCHGVIRISKCLTAKQEYKRQIKEMKGEYQILYNEVRNATSSGRANGC